MAAIIAFMVFFGIGGVPLLDPDEPVYAETAREMILTGDYLSPRIFGDYWYDKPPMYYWLVALAFHVFGDGEFAARFPAGLMAGGTALMLYFSVTKLFNERAGFWSSLVLSSSIMFFYMGKAAVTDTTLLFFMTGALLCFLHKRYWLMYICMALGTVTKGPIGVVFPGTIIFLYLLFMGQLREIFRMHPIRGILLYFMVASPWYYAMYTVHGMDFINTFLGFHNITRFTTPEHASRVTFWYYFPVIILGMFPWTGILFQSIKSSISDSRIDEMRTLMFMHVWWVFVLLFFTICKTKLVSYILPMFPALAIIIGWNISRMIAKLRYNTTFYSWIVGSGIMFTLLGIGWVIGGQQLPELEFSGLILGGLTFVLGFAALFTVIMCLMFLAYNAIAGNAKSEAVNKTIKITIPEDLDYTGAFDDIFAEFTEKSELTCVKTTNMGSMFRLTYNVTLKDATQEKQMIDRIRERNGNLEIMVSKQENRVAEL